MVGLRSSEMAFPRLLPCFGLNIFSFEQLTEQYNACRVIYFDEFPRTPNSRKVLVYCLLLLWTCWHHDFLSSCGENPIMYFNPSSIEFVTPVCMQAIHLFNLHPVWIIWCLFPVVLCIMKELCKLMMCVKLPLWLSSLH